jgi:hypothetical protein
MAVAFPETLVVNTAKLLRRWVDLVRKRVRLSLGYLNIFRGIIVRRTVHASTDTSLHSLRNHDVRCHCLSERLRGYRPA